MSVYNLCAHEYCAPEGQKKMLDPMKLELQSGYVLSFVDAKDQSWVF